MKAKYLVIGLAIVSVLCACNREEQNLFEKSAAERAQAALDNANAILSAPENGWEMLYFPNTESAGYSVLVKFEENGQVIAASRNPQTTQGKYMTDDNSTWDIRSDYGPILTFDTYNNIMHAWADPQSDGDGYLGDYEFLILEATPEKVRLKGKKHSAYCELYSMPKDLEWTEYFNQVYQHRDLLVTKNDGAAFKLEGANEDIEMVYQDGIMVIDATLGIIYPFVVRPQCITFHGKGFEAQGGNAINFTENEAKSALVCMDEGVNAQIVPALTIAEVLSAKLDNHIEWALDKKDMGSTSTAEYNELANAVKAAKGTLRNINLQRVDSTRFDENTGDTVDYKVTRLNVEYKRSTIKQAFFILDFQLDGTNMTINYKYPSGEGNDAMYASEFLQLAGGGAGKEELGLQRLKNFICGTFNVTSASGSTLNVQQLYLTGTNDSNKRIKISAK